MVYAGCSELDVHAKSVVACVVTKGRKRASPLCHDDRGVTHNSLLSTLYCDFVFSPFSPIVCIGTRLEGEEPFTGNCCSRALADFGAWRIFVQNDVYRLMRHRTAERA